MSIVPRAVSFSTSFIISPASKQRWEKIRPNNRSMKKQQQQSTENNSHFNSSESFIFACYFRHHGRQSGPYSNIHFIFIEFDTTRFIYCYTWIKQCRPTLRKSFSIRNLNDDRDYFKRHLMLLAFSLSLSFTKNFHLNTNEYSFI